MMAPIVPMSTPFAPCKVCNQAAPLYGVVDFFQTCAYERPLASLGWSGIPIYYHRCRSCGFLFTTAFDNFTDADFTKWIYNEEYIFADPEYFTDARPSRNIEFFMVIFGQHRQSLRILDYGCGKGAVSQRLRERGFSRVTSFDPYVPEFSRRPSQKFDLVFAMEVVEHSSEPRKLIADMCSFLDPAGLLLFTTQPQPEKFDQ